MISQGFAAVRDIGLAYVNSGSSTLMPHVKYFARHILYPPQTPEKLLVRCDLRLRRAVRRRAALEWGGNPRLVPGSRGRRGQSLVIVPAVPLDECAYAF